MNQHFLQSSAWEKFQQSLGRKVFHNRGEGWEYFAILERGTGNSRLYCPFGPTAINENPDEIRAMIRQGIERTKKAHKMTEIADRKQAIYQALRSAVRGDTVLITGMGHEQYRIVNGKRIPWNDKKVVQEIISEIEKLEDYINKGFCT
jgi:hypothetical protein